MATYHIKKGYTLPMQGVPERKTTSLDTPKTLGICPTDFKGIKPKLSVKLNDPVKIGTPLFFDKQQPDVQFVSPAGGTVSAINYGPRRKILEIVIQVAGKEEHEMFPSFTTDSLAKQSAEDLTSTMLKAGIWPLIRKRPFNRIADPNEKPKSIFVNCMETAPLAADPAFALEGCESSFALGVEVLKKLTSGKVHVVTSKDAKGPFSSAKGVQTHQFTGKHPAGLVGTHIAKIDPINKGECVWVVNARDTVSIGTFFATGKFPTQRVIALSGNGATETGYLKVRTGMRLNDLVGNRLKEGKVRVISGNPLTGVERNLESFLGTYESTVTLLPEPTEKHFMGWMMPGFNRPSFTRTFFSKLFPGKTFSYDTNVNGGHRAMVMSGLYEEVVALDVMPEHLVKAILSQDIELMEKLGILECDEEDFALCSYICPSKLEISSIIDQGLVLMEKDG